MSFLCMMEAKLPPGFRFHPRDEELICDYLARRIAGGGAAAAAAEGVPLMVDVDLNKCEPWDLPETACVGAKEWYFYSLRDRKYATGQRTNRATVSGYWKATGKDRQVVDPRGGGLVGMRKTLVFYQGRAPRGKKTDWVMHEFRMEGPASLPLKSSFKEDWVLCRVFYKSRGLSSKPTMDNCYDDTGSSSLPALMDSFISFEHNPLSLEGNEQVPCFSNYAPQLTPPLSHAGTSSSPSIIPYLNPYPSEKKGMKAVIDHLTKMGTHLKAEPGGQNAADGSSDSYLTETGGAAMWNTF